MIVWKEMMSVIWVLLLLHQYSMTGRKVCCFPLAHTNHHHSCITRSMNTWFKARKNIIEVMTWFYFYLWEHWLEKHMIGGIINKKYTIKSLWKNNMAWIPMKMVCICTCIPVYHKKSCFTWKVTQISLFITLLEMKSRATFRWYCDSKFSNQSFIFIDIQNTTSWDIRQNIW